MIAIILPLAADLPTPWVAGIMPVIAGLAYAIGYYIRRRSDADKARADAEVGESKASADNTARLWQTVGRLEQRIVGMENEILKQRLLKHDWRGEANALHLAKVLLSIEVNTELEKQGLPPRYDIRTILPPVVNEMDVFARHGIKVSVDGPQAPGGIREAVGGDE